MQAAGQRTCQKHRNGIALYTVTVGIESRTVSGLASRVGVRPVAMVQAPARQAGVQAGRASESRRAAAARAPWAREEGGGVSTGHNHLKATLGSRVAGDWQLDAILGQKALRQRSPTSADR
jgi:hypothetical protein